MKSNWRGQVVWSVLALASVATLFRLTAKSEVPQVVNTASAAPRTVQKFATDPSIATHSREIRLTFAPGADGRPTVPQVTQLCQFSAPDPRCLRGVDCQSWSNPCQEPRWWAARPLPFESYAQGEYVGPPRAPHVPSYLVRVNDELDFVYRFTHEETADPYRLTVGDEIMVETYPQELDSIRRGDLANGRGLQIQPDGTIVLPYANKIYAAGHTIEEVRQDIEKRLTDPNTGKFQPGAVEVVVTPLKTNTRLEDLRSAVDARFGTGGQTRTATVTPEGTVQLVGIGTVPAQGLTIPELETEVNARYVDIFGPGVQVSVILRQFAPRFVWVAGEVVQPGQYQVNQPVTVVQAIALARGFNNGGNVREIVVFRRDDNWQLMATRLDVRGVFVGKTPYPSDDIWLRDNDVVVVPKGPILRADDFINLVFTRGFYSVFPFQGTTVVRF